ncbi:hypothetical protein CO653_19440 [Rhizobium anhuiense]|uniref:Uncharacterized protein n=1 Tax=Rhizobium anhuiense TaxID=1184720 RepID=A0A432NXJ9_9HYPH|nr:hypothetical protein CO663_07795 [Rhizobium anhuiense]PDS63939.1 hypothetical protein CO653_19440 [Rhizobium anhuiense]RUM04350.1 hypothetical protein EEQ99_01965 [Rhizobium anhuiense]
MRPELRENKEIEQFHDSKKNGIALSAAVPVKCCPRPLYFYILPNFTLALPPLTLASLKAESMIPVQKIRRWLPTFNP